MFSSESTQTREERSPVIIRNAEPWCGEKLTWTVRGALLLAAALHPPVEARRVRGGRAQTRRVQQQQQTPPPYRERVEGAESFPLDFTAVEGNMDNFVVQIKNLAQSLYPCSAQKLDQDMKLHFLKNVSVTCNDGSPAG